MATFNQRDVQQLYISTTAAISTGGIGTLNDGEVGLFTPGGTRLTEASAATESEFIIVQGRDGSTSAPNIMSGRIKKADILSATYTAYAADTVQTTNIGYNGTSGSIVAANNTLYHVRINLNQSLTSNHGGVYVKHGMYESDASAAQWEIAQGLTESLIHNFSKEADKVLRPHRLCDEAGVAAATGSGTYTVTQDSKYFKANTDIDDATGNAAHVVGGFIRFGTATTDPVYQITAIDTTNDIGTLDMPYQGVSATVANNTVENILNAAGIAAEWGIVLTGQTPPFTVGKIHNTVYQWNTTLENFGTTVVADTAGAVGTGTANQVAELEWFCQGNEGDYMRMGEPNIYPSRALASGNYDLIDLIVEETYTGSIVNGPIRKVYTFALPAAVVTGAEHYDGTVAEDITDVLEVLSGATSGSLAHA